MDKQNGQLNSGLGRYSRNREVIYEALKNTKEHPDADAVYAAVKKILPDIGVATVYRNLKQLVDAGLVNMLETNRDCVHYDADTSPHAHFICEKCGKITDICVGGGPIEHLKEMGYEVKREKTVLYGVCPDCKNRT